LGTKKGTSADKGPRSSIIPGNLRELRGGGSEIHVQVSKINGRVTKLEKAALILGTSLVVSLLSQPESILTVLEAVSAWLR